jgi:hypothetical protein
MQWFEYDKAEEQLEALGGMLKKAQQDLVTHGDVLSSISITAIKNEITRLSMYMDDIQDIMDDKNFHDFEAPS